jgi:hypothetical protein
LVPGSTLSTEGSTWNPKGFYVDPKKVFLWGQPNNPFGTLFSESVHRVRNLSTSYAVFPEIPIGRFQNQEEISRISSSINGKLENFVKVTDIFATLLLL